MKFSVLANFSGLDRDDSRTFRVKLSKEDTSKKRDLKKKDFQKIKNNNEKILKKVAGQFIKNYMIENSNADEN